MPETRKDLSNRPERRNALDKSGRVSRRKLEDNQRRLNVGADHRTAGMKKGHRGTFP
jgi:hypothetical protein